MKKKFRALLSVLLALLLIGVFFLVIKDDLPDMAAAVKSVALPTVILIILLGFLYEFLDALVCYFILKARMPNVTVKQALDITFLTIFGTVTSGAITIPLQTAYLYSYGVDVGDSVGLMLTKYTFHKTTMFLCAITLILTTFSWFAASIPAAVKYIIPGCCVCLLIITALMLVCMWGKLRKFVLWLIGKLPESGKWPERKKKISDNIVLMSREMSNVIHNGKSMAGIVICGILKFATVFSIPPICLWAVSGVNLGALHGEAVSSVMWLIAGVIPNVSGLGPMDFAFMQLYAPFATTGAISAALILYRLATYFAPFFISLFAFMSMQKRVDKLFKNKQ